MFNKEDCVEGLDLAINTNKTKIADKYGETPGLPCFPIGNHPVSMETVNFDSVINPYGIITVVHGPSNLDGLKTHVRFIIAGDSDDYIHGAWWEYFRFHVEPVYPKKY
jgi:hypothetical protein